MWTLKQAVHALKSGTVSASAVCEECITRSVKLRDLNVFTTETFEDAISTAKELDSKRFNSDLGLGLYGVPFAAKDNYCTEGIASTCASSMLENYVPPYTATVVNKLQKHGGLLMGKTNLDEFAMGCGSVDSIFGAVRNPWKYDFSRSTDGSYDTWHIAGGSSGGSAVTVATGMAYAALGSDTGGSVRNPASLCGVIGLKPTYGLLSRHGLIPLVNSMDCPGIFSRNIDDCAEVLNLLAGPDVHDSTTVQQTFTPLQLPDEATVSHLHFGIPKEYHSPGLSSETIAAWTAVADHLDNAGAKVTEVSLRHSQHALACYSVLCACEVASNMARYDGLEFGVRSDDTTSTEASYADTRHHGFNTVVRGRILAGNYFLLKDNFVQYFLQAQRIRYLINQDFWNVFYNEGVDLLLTPTVLADAPVYSEFSTVDNRTRTQEQDIFTQPANMAGIPAVSVPVTLSPKGLPIGLQLMAKHFDEANLLTAAKWIEQQVNFPSLDLSYLFED